MPRVAANSGSTTRWLPRRRAVLVLIVACIVILPYGCQGTRQLPPGISFAGEPQAVDQIEFLYDLTWTDDNGTRHSEQQIFDAMLEIIAAADSFIVLDQFLFNAFLGDAPEPTRRLADELTAALIERKRLRPSLDIILITDPVNTVYGGVGSSHFDRLEDAGIVVVQTRLEALRDSNPIYSLLWRLAIRPFGNGEGGELMPNPFGTGRVSLRSYLSLLNFKANHRKTLIADAGSRVVGLVTSANPHDGSSAHTNIAIRFDGPAALDLLETENAVLEFSGLDPYPIPDPVNPAPNGSPVSVQIVTEKQIKQAVLAAIADAAPGDALSLAMFYLSDRDVIEALKEAQLRGVDARVLLDPNKDAFGRQKNGVPARPVAHELTAAGLPVRWCDTHGEQCHMKMLQIDYVDDSSVLIAGSANLTRRNLEDFNLETNVAVRGPSETKIFADADEFFSLMWNNAPGRQISVAYPDYADESLLKRVQYRVMEASGLSTF